jgi:hypothetical protein
MRYHWGLGVGHLHAHHSASTSAHIPDSGDTDAQDGGSADLEHPELGPSHKNVHFGMEGHETDEESDNPELSLDDDDPEGWQDVDADGSDDGSDDDNRDCDINFESESEDFVGM